VITSSLEAPALTRRPVEVLASQPALLGQYVAGGQLDAGLGDPSLILAPAVSTWTTDPLLVVPTSLTASARIVAHCADVGTGSGVRLDGTPIPASAWTVAFRSTSATSRRKPSARR
jgi:hypothetical protein